MKMTKPIYVFLIFVFLNACSPSSLKKLKNQTSCGLLLRTIPLIT